MQFWTCKQCKCDLCFRFKASAFTVDEGTSAERLYFAGGHDINNNVLSSVAYYDGNVIR
jgi:hypothetical protein